MKLSPVVFVAAVALLASCVHARVVDTSMLRMSLPHGTPSVAYKAATYDPTVALSRVYSSGIAYCNSSCISTWTCPPCEVVPNSQPIAYLYNASLDIAGYVTVMDNSAFISFRGTVPSSLQNWIDDLNFSKTAALDNCDGCEVHSGFLDSYLSVRDQVLAALNTIPDAASASVVITGHSLGAAIANLAAYDLSTAFPVDVVYDFGQPRVGNPAYAAAYAAAVSEFRVVHYADIVPHLPLQDMGFQHVPTEVWYQEDNTDFQVCDGSGEDPNCSDSLLIDISVSDHLDYLNVHLSKLC